MPIVKPERPGGSAESDRPLRILIVDDQLVVRGALRSALDKLERPILVIEAGTGEEALGIMQNAQVDVIFCDIQLPGISGPEALAHAYGVAAERPFMVLMSTRHTSEFRVIGQGIGVYEFLAKPFKAFDVLNAIAAYDRLRRVTRTLLIDDSATARKLMTRILGRSQFHIELHEAASGAEAIRLAHATDFDVIFCDFNMPDLDGVETAGNLLRLNPAAQIVLISTEQQASMVRSAQFVGAFAFLKKPFDASDVDAVLHDAFAIKRPSIAKPTHAIFSNEEAVRGRGGAAKAVGKALGGAGVA
ncbi:MAG: Signal transduction histidine [Beijerinckiaceae bacterium]|nr:MAG: Signal transduction histidine [Beijerinckiaceae bacterium]